MSCISGKPCPQIWLKGDPHRNQQCWKIKKLLPFLLLILLLWKALYTAFSFYFSSSLCRTMESNHPFPFLLSLKKNRGFWFFYFYFIFVIVLKGVFGWVWFWGIYLIGYWPDHYAISCLFLYFILDANSFLVGETKSYTSFWIFIFTYFECNN